MIAYDGTIPLSAPDGPGQPTVDIDAIVREMGGIPGVGLD